MANNNNEDITIKIDVDTSDVEKGFTDIEKASKKMSKDIEKSNDKVEKSFDDVEKSLKDVQKTMNTTFKNINFNSLANNMKRTMQQVQRQVQSTANNIKSQLQKALNIKSSIDVKANTTTDASGASSMVGNMMGELVGSSMSSGAIGSQIAKTLAQSQKDILKSTNNIKQAFEQLPEPIQESIKGSVSNVYDTVQEFVPLITQLREVMDFDLSDPQELKGLILGMQDDVKILSQETENGLKKLVEWKEKLSLSDKDLDVSLMEEEINRLNQKLEQLKQTLADVSKLDFILNLDTNESVVEIDRLLAKFDEIPNRINKADIEPIIQQMQNLKQQMESLGIDTSILDNVLTEWSNVCNTGSQATTKLTNEMLKARENVTSLQQGTQQLVGAQTALAQKQRELA